MKTRIEESLDIMKKIYRDLKVPKSDSGAKELSYRLSECVKNGKAWAGYIALPSIKRHLHVIIPNNPAMEIRVVLKAQTE